MTQRESTRDTVARLAREAAEAEGFALYHVDFQGRNPRQVVRVFIEPAEGDSRSSVTLDDCGLVSRRLSTLLEVEDPISGAFVLEVSSPGLERGLYRPEHYRRAAGARVKLRTLAPVDGQRNFEGRLSGLSPDGTQVLLDVDGRELDIAFENVAKAHLVYTGEPR